MLPKYVTTHQAVRFFIYTVDTKNAGSKYLAITRQFGKRADTALGDNDKAAISQFYLCEGVSNNVDGLSIAIMQ